MIRLRSSGRPSYLRGLRVHRLLAPLSCSPSPSSSTARREERAAGSCLDRSERNAQAGRDLGLRQPAPVGELDQCAFALGKSLSSALWTRHLTQSDSARSGGPGCSEGRSGTSSGRLDADARLVDDRVPCDAVKPGRARTALGPVGRRGTPDRCERLLGRILGAAAIAKPPDCQAEHRSREAPVELLERLAVTLGRPPDQLAVTTGLERGPRGRSARLLALAESRDSRARFQRAESQLVSVLLLSIPSSCFVSS